MAWDATCPNTYAQSYIKSTSRLAGSAAAGAELLKQKKYSYMILGVDFVPFAIETSGVWGEEALRLVTEIGRRTAYSHTRTTINSIPASADLNSRSTRKRSMHQ